MTVKGLSSLNRKFKRLPKEAEIAARTAIAKSADEIIAMMRNLVPVDDGQLRNSIGWSFGGAPEGSKIIGSVKGGKELTATIYAGDDKAFYARWVEFGTVKTRAQPFFFPSYNANRMRAKSRIKSALSKSARKEAKL